MIAPAHGIGGRTDLPLPGELVLQAGGVVVLVSFLLVGLAWRRPRFHGRVAGRPMPAWLQRLAAPGRPGRRGRLGRLRWVGPAVRWLMLALLTHLVVMAFAGPPDADHNPAPRALYVLLWVGLVPASLLLGPVWRVLNPLRALHRALATVLRLPRGGVRALPKGLGYWPTALGLAGFVWLELVPDVRAEPPVVGGFLLGYAVLSTGAALWFGTGWFDHADPFEAYSSLVGALSPVGMRLPVGSPADPPGGGLAWRNPLRGLNEVGAAPGLVAVLAVWWGSTVFDGLSGTPWWASSSQAAAVATGLPAALIATVVLAALVALVAGSYRLAAGRLAETLVSTLIPIAVGYTIAHYVSLLMVEGPRGVAQLVDPSAEGPAGVPAPLVIAAIQLASVLLGHVVGVLAAHDRVLALDLGVTNSVAGVATSGAAPVSEQRRLADQLPLVLLMVGYTMIGLYLLVIA